MVHQDLKFIDKRLETCIPKMDIMIEKLETYCYKVDIMTERLETLSLQIAVLINSLNEHLREVKNMNNQVET